MTSPSKPFLKKENGQIEIRDILVAPFFLIGILLLYLSATIGGSFTARSIIEFIGGYNEKWKELNKYV